MPSGSVPLHRMSLWHWERGWCYLPYGGSNRQLQMNEFRNVAVLSLALLALAGCHKKPADQAPSKPSMVASLFSPRCPVAPEKAAVQNGLHNAMLQIYGVDEVSARFTVLRISSTDCKHMTVTFRASAAGSASQTSAMAYGDDDKWYLSLYGKQYPAN